MIDSVKKMATGCYTPSRWKAPGNSNKGLWAVFWAYSQCGGRGCSPRMASWLHQSPDFQSWFKCSLLTLSALITDGSEWFMELDETEMKSYRSYPLVAVAATPTSFNWTPTGSFKVGVVDRAPRSNNMRPRLEATACQAKLKHTGTERCRQQRLTWRFDTFSFAKQRLAESIWVPAGTRTPRFLGEISGAITHCTS